MNKEDKENAAARQPVKKNWVEPVCYPISVAQHTEITGNDGADGMNVS